MSTNHIPKLHLVESVGPAHNPQGEILATPCGGCQKPTDAGELITKYRRSWWHDACAQRDITAGHAKEAWLALGHDLARSPGSYRVKETRAIVGALLGMIHEPDEYTEDDFSRPIGGLA